MSAFGRRTAGAALAAVLLVGGATACENGTKDDSGKAGGAPSPAAAQAAGGSATEAIAAAYKKTSAAKSAKVHMTMKMSGGLGGQTVEMTGVQGWDPQVMDITMKGGLGGLGGPGGLGGAAADSVRMVMAGEVMYMEMPPGSPMASEVMEGKRWMKIDTKAAGELYGDAAMKKLGGGMGGGMSGMDRNQDPAKQLALLLASPNVKLIGSEKVAGTDTQHYEGTLTFDEMLAANPDAKALPEADRAQLTEAMKKAGIKGYGMDVWVDKDGYPARMKVSIGTPGGALDVDAQYSDYATAANIQTPPENETLDVFAKLKELGATGAGRGAGA
ncbi:hypothetical protein ACFXA3_01695 [Streptomyces sp. NPDC059456]|uniref:hypothetical protein n=1 Tax=Streptomyces sp. NPDC059456 TaxID=3346838 RepID=UPI003673CBE5